MCSPSGQSSDLLNSEKLVNFLRKIYKGYRTDVAYHNDLHGLDVAQMLYMMIKEGKLAEVAQLNHLDLVSALTASACHDYAHDGFNNAYHVNFMTDRALRYHDKAVQENWHASESMKILLTADSNFIETLGADERKVFRKRMIGMILATDMAEHMTHVNLIDYKIKNKGIEKEKRNGALVIETESENDKFNSQQQILEFMIHTSDLSTPTREFETLKHWTYLLFEEFFIQGDVEKSKSLPASFLCDREKTIVAKEQPGFCNYIVLPIWNLASVLLPQMDPCYQRALENTERWKAYEETQEDMTVYELKECAYKTQAIKTLNLEQANL